MRVGGCRRRSLLKNPPGVLKTPPGVLKNPPGVLKNPPGVLKNPGVAGTLPNKVKLLSPLTLHRLMVAKRPSGANLLKDPGFL